MFFRRASSPLFPGAILVCGMPLPGTSKLTSAFVSCSSQDQAWDVDADEHEGKMTNHIEVSRRWCVGEEPTHAQTFSRTFGAAKPSPDRLTRPMLSPPRLVRVARACTVRQHNFDVFALH